MARRWFVRVCLVASALALCTTALSDPRTARLAWHSILLSVGAALISVPIGTAAAVAIVRTHARGRRACLVLFVGLLWLPLFVHAASWEAALGDRGWATVSGVIPAWLVGWRGAVWVHSVAALPWVVLIVAAGLWEADSDLEDNALLDASAFQVLLRVTLRGAAGAMATASMWVMIVTAGEMQVSTLFQLGTFAEEIYNDIALGLELGEASIRTLPGVAVCGLLVAASLAIVVRLGLLARNNTLRPASYFRLGRSRFLVTGALVALTLILVGLPLSSLCWKSGVVVSQVPGGLVRTWSLAKLVSITLESPFRYARPLLWSAAIGVLAASAAVTAAIGLAWLARGGRWRGWTGAALAALALALPGPVVGLAVIALFNSTGWDWTTWLYDRTLAPPWIAQSFRAFPLAFLIQWQALGTIAGEQTDAAALDGAGRWTALYRIGVRARLPALAIAWTAALALSVGELGATILVAPPGIETLSVHVFNLLHGGYEDEVSGICLALFACSLAAGAMVGWLARRGAK